LFKDDDRIVDVLERNDNINTMFLAWVEAVADVLRSREGPWLPS